MQTTAQPVATTGDIHDRLNGTGNSPFGAREHEPVSEEDDPLQLMMYLKGFAGVTTFSLYASETPPAWFIQPNPDNRPPAHRTSHMISERLAMALTPIFQLTLMAQSDGDVEGRLTRSSKTFEAKQSDKYRKQLEGIGDKIAEDYPGFYEKNSHLETHEMIKSLIDQLNVDPEAVRSIPMEDESASLLDF